MAKVYKALILILFLKDFSYHILVWLEKAVILHFVLLFAYKYSQSHKQSQQPHILAFSGKGWKACLLPISKWLPWLQGQEICLFPSCPRLAHVTFETMNFIYRSGDAYQRNKQWSGPLWQLTFKCPWVFKRYLGKNIVILNEAGFDCFIYIYVYNLYNISWTSCFHLMKFHVVVSNYFLELQAYTSNLFLKNGIIFSPNLFYFQQKH